MPARQGEVPPGRGRVWPHPPFVQKMAGPPHHGPLLMTQPRQSSVLTSSAPKRLPAARCTPAKIWTHLRATLRLPQHPSTGQAENPAAGPGLPRKKSGRYVFSWSDHWATPQGAPAGSLPEAWDQGPTGVEGRAAAPRLSRWGPGREAPRGFL